jgi:hypothetical protein
VARPCISQDVCRSFAGRCPRDQGPPAVLGASRLFVLLVAARRWVLAGNRVVYFHKFSIRTFCSYCGVLLVITMLSFWFHRYSPSVIFLYLLWYYVVLISIIILYFPLLYIEFSIMTYFLCKITRGHVLP